MCVCVCGGGGGDGLKELIDDPLKYCVYSFCTCVTNINQRIFFTFCIIRLSIEEQFSSLFRI